MKYKIFFDPSAVRALIRANLAGPNCIRNEKKLVKLYQINKKISLKKIADYFDENFGPISSVINYVVKNKMTNKILTSEDIVKIYCLDHQKIVSTVEYNYLYKNETYFKELLENGFQLGKKDLKKLMFSCIGKVGEVVQVKNNFCKIRFYTNGRTVFAYNVFSPVNICKGGLVAVHFAAVFARINEQLFEEIWKKQNNKFFNQFKKIKQIHFDKWLKGNLSEFTKKQFKKLP